MADDQDFLVRLNALERALNDNRAALAGRGALDDTANAKFDQQFRDIGLARDVELGRRRAPAEPEMSGFGSAGRSALQGAARIIPNLLKSPYGGQLRPTSMGGMVRGQPFLDPLWTGLADLGGIPQIPGLTPAERLSVPMDWAASTLPAPDPKRRYWNAVGGAAPYAAAALLGPEAAIPLAAGFAVEGGGAGFDEARAGGADVDTATGVGSITGAVSGLSGLVGMKVPGGPVASTLLKVGEGSALGGVQDALNTGVKRATYDPKAELNTGPAMFAGGLGTGAGHVVGLAGGGGRNELADAAARAKADAATESARQQQSRLAQEQIQQDIEAQQQAGMTQEVAARGPEGQAPIPVAPYTSPDAARQAGQRLTRRSAEETEAKAMQQRVREMHAQDPSALLDTIISAQRNPEQESARLKQMLGTELSPGVTVRQWANLEMRRRSVMPAHDENVVKPGATVRVAKATSPADREYVGKGGVVERVFEDGAEPHVMVRLDGGGRQVFRAVDMEHLPTAAHPGGLREPPSGAVEAPAPEATTPAGEPTVRVRAVPQAEQEPPPDIRPRATLAELPSPSGESLPEPYRVAGVTAGDVQTVGEMPVGETTAAQQEPNVRFLGGESPAVETSAPSAEQAEPQVKQAELPLAATAATGEAREGDQAADVEGAVAGASNTVFTRERRDAASKRLLDPNKLRSGISPEDIADLVTIAGFHIEAGARDFKAWAEDQVRQFGERVRPALRGAWDRAFDDHEKARASSPSTPRAAPPLSSPTSGATAVASTVGSPSSSVAGQAPSAPAPATGAGAIPAPPVAGAAGGRGGAAETPRRDASSAASSPDAAFTPPDYGFLDRVIQWWQDDKLPVKRVQEAIERSGGTIPERQNVHDLENLMSEKVSQEFKRFTKDAVEPLGQEMGRAGIKAYWLNPETGERQQVKTGDNVKVMGRRLARARELEKQGFYQTDDLDQYLRARHAPERNAYIASINPKMPDGGSGMTNAEADAIMSRLASEGRVPSLENMAARVDAITAATRDLIAARGLETGGTVDAWRAGYEHYVPLKGFAADATGEGTPSRSGRGVSIGGPESKTAMGRSSAAASTWGNALRDHMVTVERAEKNDVANAMRKMIEANPAPDFWEVFSEDNPEATRRLDVRWENPATGKTSAKPRDGWSRRATVRDSARNLALFGNDYVGAKAGGKQYYLGIKDARLRDALLNASSEDVHKVLRAVHVPMRYLSAMATQYNPAFVLTNFARDIQTAATVALSEQGPGGKIEGRKVVAKTMAAVPSAMKTIAQESRGAGTPNPEMLGYWKEMQQQGGTTGWYQVPPLDVQRARVQKVIDLASGETTAKFKDGFRATKDFVSDINGAVENGTRLAFYASLRRDGVTPQQAAVMSKNLTVNFNRRGSGGPLINAAYLFANAGIQGTAMMARVLNTRRGRQLAGGAIALGMLQALLGEAMSEDDKDGRSFYSKIPDYEKERNWIVMQPNGHDYFKIPLPYGLNVLHNVGSATADVLNDNRSVAGGASFLGSSFLGAFNPIGSSRGDVWYKTMLKSGTPTLAKPFAELATNENYYGAPIYKEQKGYGAKQPRSELAFKNTPQWARQSARFLNEVSGGTPQQSGRVDIHPDTLEYVGQTVLGGLGRFASDVAATGQSAATPGAEVDVKRVPFVRAFAGTPSPIGDRNLFYERVDKLKQFRERYKALLGTPALADLRRDHPGALGMLPVMVGLEKALTGLRARLKNVESKEPASPEEAVEQSRQVDMINDQMDTLVQRFNARYDKDIGRHK